MDKGILSKLVKTWQKNELSYEIIMKMNDHFKALLIGIISNLKTTEELSEFKDNEQAFIFLASLTHNIEVVRMTKLFSQADFFPFLEIALMAILEGKKEIAARGIIATSYASKKDFEAIKEKMDKENEDLLFIAAAKKGKKMAIKWVEMLAIDAENNDRKLAIKINTAIAEFQKDK